MLQRAGFSWQHQAVVISEQTRLKFMSQRSNTGSLVDVLHKDRFRRSLPHEFPPCAGDGQKCGAFARRTSGARSVPAPKASLAYPSLWDTARGHPSLTNEELAEFYMCSGVQGC